MGSGFEVLDSSICQWNLDSGYQSLVGFRIPWAVFQIPKPRIPDSISPIRDKYVTSDEWLKLLLVVSLCLGLMIKVNPYNPF